MNELIQHGRGADAGFDADRQTKRRAVIAESKAKLRVLAILIREAKRKWTTSQRNREPIRHWAHVAKWQAWEYRHRHIALCMFRGRTLQQIEGNARIAPSQELIRKYRRELEVSK